MFFVLTTSGEKNGPIAAHKKKDKRRISVITKFASVLKPFVLANFLVYVLIFHKAQRIVKDCNIN